MPIYPVLSNTSGWFFGLKYVPSQARFWALFQDGGRGSETCPPGALGAADLSADARLHARVGGVPELMSSDGIHTRAAMSDNAQHEADNRRAYTPDGARSALYIH